MSKLERGITLNPIGFLKLIGDRLRLIITNKFSKFHGSGSNKFRDIMLTRFYCTYTKYKCFRLTILESIKGHNPGTASPTEWRLQWKRKSSPKFNRTIYTFVPNCLQNSASLTQMVPSMFCLHDFHLVKCLRQKRGRHSIMKNLTEKKNNKGQQIPHFT